MKLRLHAEKLESRDSRGMHHAGNATVTEFYLWNSHLSIFFDGSNQGIGGSSGTETSYSGEIALSYHEARELALFLLKNSEWNGKTKKRVLSKRPRVSGDSASSLSTK